MATTAKYESKSQIVFQNKKETGCMEMLGNLIIKCEKEFSRRQQNVRISCHLISVQLLQ